MGSPNPCRQEFCEDCDRFGAWYRLTGTQIEAHSKAKDICLEQTVELPADLVPEGFIKDKVLGQIVEFGPAPGSRPEAWRALITHLNDNVGSDLPQLLNVLYGNISLKQGFKLERLKDCRKLWNRFKGPRFGRKGLRDLLGVPRRPLLCTALTHRSTRSAKAAKGWLATPWSSLTISMPPAENL